MDPIFLPLFGEPEVAACLSDEARLQRMLDVEAALAESAAALGLIPPAAAVAIRASAVATLFDRDAIAVQSAKDGNLAIPLVRELTRIVAQRDPEAARYVHWGATSQDIIDTGLILQLDAAMPVIDGLLRKAAAAAADLARRHIDLVMPGRTWLQQATPVTFGLKAAGWLDALMRARERLESAWQEARCLQFGGATGTLAALGTGAGSGSGSGAGAGTGAGTGAGEGEGAAQGERDGEREGERERERERERQREQHGIAMLEDLARRLQLRIPDVPWHAARDRLAHVAATAGIAVGSCGKIARDVALLAQTEIAEAREGTADGRGGSSTMPHKQNPVSAATIIAASLRAPGLVATMLQAMPQEHERGLGGWQAEWPTLPELMLLTAGAARATHDLLANLVIDPDRMRANLQSTGGLLMAEAVSMALAARIGKSTAHTLVEAATRRAFAEQRPLREVLIAEPQVTAHLREDHIDRLLAPDNYLGSARTLVQRVLARYEAHA